LAGVIVDNVVGIKFTIPIPSDVNLSISYKDAKNAQVIARVEQIIIKENMSIYGLANSDKELVVLPILIPKGVA
jgi:hypothetical protein